MSASHFNEYIDDIPGVVIYKTPMFRTSSGQPFQILINQVVWYAVRVIYEDDPKFSSNELLKSCAQAGARFKLSEHLTIGGAKDKMALLKNDLLSY